MSEGPRLTGFRLHDPLPQRGEAGIIATITIEDGSWIASGFALCVDDRGKPFLRPPRMKSQENRIALKPGPHRSALLKEAVKLAASFIELRSAVSPLAPAPETVEMPE
jgi:hypothetical protein